MKSITVKSIAVETATMESAGKAANIYEGDELNYWGSTECKKASYDEKSREWTVVVQWRRRGNRP
jgi:hypothetical protein